MTIRVYLGIVRFFTYLPAVHLMDTPGTKTTKLNDGISVINDDSVRM
jgi:hypothetical protein